MMNADYVKPIAAIGVAVALDKYVLNQPDLNSSLYFGVATGAGVAAAGLFSTYLPDLSATFATTSYYSAKTVEKRLLEVAMATGAGYKHCVMVTQNAKSKEIKRNYYHRNQERLLEYKRNYRLNKIKNSQDEITSNLN